VWVKLADDLFLLCNDAPTRFQTRQTFNVLGKLHIFQNPLAPTSPGQTSVARLATVFQGQANVYSGAEGLYPIEHAFVSRGT